MKEKNPKKFSIKMQKKLLCLYVLIILAFILLSFRLSWIVRADGADYEKQVLSQQNTIPSPCRLDVVTSWMPRERSLPSVKRCITWS